MLAVIDPDDAHHAAAVAVLHVQEAAGRTFRLPSVVLAEALVGETRVNPERVDRLRASLIEAFGAVRVLDEEIAVAAARLRATHRALRLPDAVVLATGIVDGCSAILTADRRWSAVDSRVVTL
ncbi:MAG TPA: PIN domain-containing protein [Cryptosporangiaceae bacterium]|nr:PIN domain-containing protein [Cryptosporangiaceae bacterium]